MALGLAFFSCSSRCQRLFQVDQLQKMAPVQLSRQCRDNLLIRVSLGKTAAMEQLFLTPAFAKRGGELLRETGHHLLAIIGPLTLEHFGIDTLTDLPVMLPSLN